MDSLICVIDRSLENNAFSVLHYVINVALHCTLKGVFVWENPNPDFRIQKRIMNLRSPVSAIHARVQHHIGNVFFCVYGEHFLTPGATFSLWRDFFLPARLFFPRATFSQRRDFFSLARLFFAGATLFSLARLFLSGATFFRRRDFFCFFSSAHL